MMNERTHDQQESDWFFYLVEKLIITDATEAVQHSEDNHATPLSNREDSDITAEKSSFISSCRPFNNLSMGVKNDVTLLTKQNSSDVHPDSDLDKYDDHEEGIDSSHFDSNHGIKIGSARRKTPSDNNRHIAPITISDNCVQENGAVGQSVIFAIHLVTPGLMQEMNSDDIHDVGQFAPIARCHKSIVDEAMRQSFIELKCQKCWHHALLNSLEFRHDDCAIKWISFRIPLNEKDYDEQSHYINQCRASGSYRIATSFLEAGVSSDRSRNRFVAPHLPCPKCRHAALVKSLDEHHYCCAKQWIEFGISVNGEDCEGRSAIISLCHRGAPEFVYLDLVKLFISSGLDVNYCGAQGITPLHIAAHWGNSHIATLLLEAGADINSTDADGESVISWTNDYTEDEKCLLVCLAAGGDPNTVNNSEISPLKTALRDHRERVAECLILSGATIGIAEEDLEIRPQLRKAMDQRRELNLSLRYLCRSHITKHLMHIHNNHSNMFALVRKLELPEGLRRILICDDYYLPDKDTFRICIVHPEHVYSSESDTDDSQ